MPYSMTGFGAAEGGVGGGRLRVEIRTVNHRHFHLAARLPADLARFEGELRERLRLEFDRGHVAVQAWWTQRPPASLGFHIDLARARLVAERLQWLKDELLLGGEVTVDLVARQPEVVVSGAEADGGDLGWDEVEPVLVAAARDCVAMRAREGEALAAELRRLLDLLEAGAGRVAAAAPERLVRERDRLQASVAQLLDGRTVDEARVAQELAHAADRLDITEELVRLAAHVAACRAALAAPQPAGKRLGFLAQELGREVNTIGSKANHAGIAHEVVGMKGELEKFREQLENLE